MKNAIKTLVLAGLMSTGLAQATDIPAEIDSSPGVLFVNWQESPEMTTAAGQKLEVRDEYGTVLASVPADTTGTQVVGIPFRTHGDLMVSLGSNSSQYHVPYGMGGGREH
jgi:hypothetical protein